MRRLFAGIALALIVLAVAVTPLAATFRPAYFDIRYVDSVTHSVLTATVQDQTGLVAGATYSPGATPTTSGRTTRLVVDLAGGCDNPSLDVKFVATGDAYRVTEHTTGTSCQYDFLQGRPFVFALRAPIDASSVQVVHV